MGDGLGDMGDGVPVLLEGESMEKQERLVPGEVERPLRALSTVARCPASCVCMWVCVWGGRAQSCPTLCNSMDCSPQAPPSMGFSRQGYWSGLPLPPPWDLPDPGLQPVS